MPMLAVDSLWDRLRSSLWFLPTLLVIGAVVLAVGLIEVDAVTGLSSWKENWPRLFGAGAEGSRGMLSAIASSMITVAGVAFSITIVALALASSQYTSRILRNFMRDRANQFVLGTFLGIFVYCVVVLRTIRGGEEGVFVPSIAVLFAVVLSLVGIGCLIFFIHHIASSIQAESIIKSAADETLESIDRLFPDDLADSVGPHDGPLFQASSGAWYPVCAGESGYIQAIEGDGLLSLARERDALIRMECGAGEFVVEGAPLITIVGVDPPDDELTRAVNALYTLGRQRSTVQDAGFGVRQIVDIALKALSPGINDTTTAVTCVHYLSAVLARLAARRLSAPCQAEGGKVFVIVRGATFPGLLGEAFDQIRRNADGNVAVLFALLEALAVVATRTQDVERLQAVARQVELIADVARKTIPSLPDRGGIEAALDRHANRGIAWEKN